MQELVIFNFQTLFSGTRGFCKHELNADSAVARIEDLLKKPCNQLDCT
jgi:hypothetical protein